jgi:hypothetical protein
VAVKRVVSHLLFAAALACSNAILAQEEVRFGAPVRAISALPDSSLSLSTASPPRELARDSEIVLVSGYEPSKGATGIIVHVNVDRPGSKVLLVMTSYEKVNWVVTASNGTNISGILVSGYYPPTVTTTLQTQGYISKLPYAYETDNVKFKELLVRLNAFFGIDRIDVFRGSYSIPSAVSISAVDPPRVELSLKGPLPKVPITNFTFDLLTTDYSKVRWTLAGPVEKAYDGKGKIVVSEFEKLIYKLNGDQLEIVDSTTGQSIVAVLPPNFPRFSWAMDIAYDLKRKIICVVSLGGEGFLYRFDTRQRQWIDYRSLNNVDIFSLSYDEMADRYVAWTDRGRLIFISGDGAAMFTKNVISRLEGFGRLYDRGNSRVPRVQLVPKGDDIALVYISGNTVSNIWHYNVKAENAVLTYAWTKELSINNPGER